MTEINPEVLPHEPIVYEDETPEQRLRALRFVRGNKLQATDWWAVQDRTMTQEERDYRQALRDITDHYSNLEDVVWPTLGGSNGE